MKAAFRAANLWHMASDHIAKAIQALHDRNSPTETRVLVAGELGADGSEAALNALLAVAEADNEDGPVANAAGAAIAEILLRRDRVYEAALAMFNGPAYLGFDEAVARHQRGGS
jgi:hypothetical protein